MMLLFTGLQLTVLFMYVGDQVIRRMIRLRGVCLEFVFVSQPMCLSWRFRICQMTYVPLVEVPDISNGYGYVIKI
ncbi:unnamed protein product [Camellia sinensis]